VINLINTLNIKNIKSYKLRANVLKNIVSSNISKNSKNYYKKLFIKHVNKLFNRKKNKN